MNNSVEEAKSLSVHDGDGTVATSVSQEDTGTTRSSRPELIDDSSDLPLPIGIAEEISNALEPPKQIDRKGFCRRQGDGDENIDIEAPRHIWNSLSREETKKNPCHLNTLKNR